MQKFINASRIIPQHQLGFRADHSTTHQLQNDYRQLPKKNFYRGSIFRRKNSIRHSMVRGVTLKIEGLQHGFSFGGDWTILLGWTDHSKSELRPSQVRGSTSRQEYLKGPSWVLHSSTSTATIWVTTDDAYTCHLRRRCTNCNSTH